MKRKDATLFKLTACISVLTLLFVMFLYAGFQLPLVLLFGWVIYPFKVLPKMTAEPAASVVAGASLVLLLVVTHRLACWLPGRKQSGGEPRRWKFRWTLATVFLVLFLFEAGIALLGTVHQIGWLLSADYDAIDTSRASARRSQSAHNLDMFGLACNKYDENFHRLPSGGTFDLYGEPGHSWETHLLPYLDRPRGPNLALPWKHPDNAQHFQVVIREFTHPAYDDLTDDEGYALSHYAANQLVMRGNSAMGFKDITDGRANTLLIGEVNANFRPWGDPFNWRDPALGINVSDGFGGPKGYGGAQFVFVDGHVQFFSEKTDHGVLKALATPAGGEKVDENL